jgi:hypothetical protein
MERLGIERHYCESVATKFTPFRSVRLGELTVKTWWQPSAAKVDSLLTYKLFTAKRYPAGPEIIFRLRK